MSTDSGVCATQARHRQSARFLDLFNLWKVQTHYILYPPSFCTSPTPYYFLMHPSKIKEVSILTTSAYEEYLCFIPLNIFCIKSYPTTLSTTVLICEFF
jgi:hypothetical protein